MRFIECVKDEEFFVATVLLRFYYWTKWKLITIAFKGYFLCENIFFMISTVLLKFKNVAGDYMMVI